MDGRCVGSEGSAELLAEARGVRADPFLGDEAIGDPIELAADVLDCPPGRGEAEVLAGL